MSRSPGGGVGILQRCVLILAMFVHFVFSIFVFHPKQSWKSCSMNCFKTLKETKPLSEAANFECKSRLPRMGFQEECLPFFEKLTHTLILQNKATQFSCCGKTCCISSAVGNIFPCCQDHFWTNIRIILCIVCCSFGCYAQFVLKFPKDWNCFTFASGSWSISQNMWRTLL